ncbi:DNA repair protein RecO [Candidatus Gottesmanbacteria bacterium]|nr:DNA repair protein RecO [Candidatus Gottesmanbacteria bacterium]
MHGYYKIEAVVLKRANIGEADKLLTLFTRSHGKLTVIAKGVRKVTSRKASHLELFRHIQGFVASSSSIPILIEATSLEIFSRIRKDIRRIAFAYRIVEQVDRLCPENEVHITIFPILLQSFRMLSNKGSNFETVSFDFTHNLLWELGYLPRTTTIEGQKLESFLEHILETKLKSNSLLTRVTSSI